MKKSLPDELTEFESGDRVLFEGTGIEVTFIDASTASMDNDDVITDTVFNIKYNNIETEIRIEITNGQPAIYEIYGYRITLDFADGYSQFCGLKLSRI